MSDEKVYVIGSAPDCDIVVDEPHVSGHHCKLHFDRGGFLIEDLDSTNGTYVNGVRISEATIITKGETVTLGRKVPLPWPGSETEKKPATAAAAPPPVAAPKTPPAPAAPPPEPQAAPPAEPPSAKPIPMEQTPAAAAKPAPAPADPSEPPAKAAGKMSPLEQMRAAAGKPSPAAGSPPAAPAKSDEKLSPLEQMRAAAGKPAPPSEMPTPPAESKDKLSPLEQMRAAAGKPAPAADAPPAAPAKSDGKMSPLEQMRAAAGKPTPPAEMPAPPGESGGKPSPLEQMRAAAGKPPGAPAKPKASPPPAAKPAPAAATPKPKASPKPKAKPKPKPSAPPVTPPELKELPPPSPASSRPSPRFTDPYALDPETAPKKGNAALLVGAGVAVLICLGLILWTFFGPRGNDGEGGNESGNGGNQTTDGTGNGGGNAGTDDPTNTTPNGGENEPPDKQPPVTAATDPRDAVVWLGYELAGTANRYASGFAVAPGYVLTSETNQSWIKNALDDADVVVLVGNGRETVRAESIEVVEVSGAEYGLLKVVIPEMKSLVPTAVETKSPGDGAALEFLTWDSWDSKSSPKVKGMPSRVRGPAPNGSGFLPELDARDMTRKFQGAAVLSGGKLVGMLNIAADGNPVVLPIPDALR